MDWDCNVLVVYTENHVLRKVTLSDMESALAGNGQKDFTDGVCAAVRFNDPWGIVVDAQDVFFVTDSENLCVLQVDPRDGTVMTLVGASKKQGFTDGQRAAAQFKQPCGLALDVDDNLIVTDFSNQCIRREACNNDGWSRWVTRIC